MSNFGNQLGELFGRIVRDWARSMLRNAENKRRREYYGGKTRTSKANPYRYPGDYTGTPKMVYAPRNDRDADPGEVAWAWVPYEEEYNRGKDRPVLVIGRSDGWLLALPLTSKDHDVDEDQERRAGRYWQDIGSGSWDSQGRPSEVRLDRIVRIDPAKVRRTGGKVSEGVFRNVAAGVRKHR